MLNTTDKRKIEKIIKERVTEHKEKLRKKQKESYQKKIEEIEKTPPEEMLEKIKRLNKIKKEAEKIVTEINEKKESGEFKGWGFDKGWGYTEAKPFLEKEYTYNRPKEDTLEDYYHPKIKEEKEKIKIKEKEIDKAADNAILEIYTGSKPPLEILEELTQKTEKIIESL